MSKLKNCIEGIIITALGVLFLFFALGVRNNPVPYEIPWVNDVAQAKFLPIVMATMVTILGVVAIIQGLRGKMPPAKYTKEEGKRLGIVLLLTVAYLLGIYYFGFRWPTVIFSVVATLYFNWGKRPWWQMLIICAVYIGVGLFGLPKLIGLRLV